MLVTARGGTTCGPGPPGRIVGDWVRDTAYARVGQLPTERGQSGIPGVNRKLLQGVLGMYAIRERCPLAFAGWSGSLVASSTSIDGHRRATSALSHEPIDDPS